MQRSLYSGVTGLTNHQLILDTTANNLANISTNGFKGSRISFSTALLQTQNAGSSPTASAVIVTWANSQFSVSIENSALNTSTHSARNSEAVTIANAIAAVALNDPELAGLLGIHVEYVAREAGVNKPRVVDSIDFRRDSSGGMALHTT